MALASASCLAPNESKPDTNAGSPVGIAEIAIAVCLFLWLFRTVAYGAALALHAVTVLVSWRQLLHPWADPVNHLFIASVPVLGALIALFLLRHWDRAAIAALPAADNA